MTSLGEDFPKQQARVRELLTVYLGLPGGAGAFGAAMLEQTLQRADAAAMSGDVIAMLRSYEEMKNCE